MRSRWILVLLAALGLTLFTTMSRAEDDKKKEGEENEVKIKLSDCPAAVQETLKKEAGGAEIKEVDKETDDGKTVYKTDVTIDGKEVEIKVAEDGKLISKKVEDDKDEKKEDDDKDKKEEKK